MRILLNRLPLFMGIFLLQVPPIAGAPVTGLADLLLQSLGQVPVYVIMAYVLITQQRNSAKESERRDAHEKSILELLGTQMNRLDVIEDDRKEVEKERNETTRLQAQSSKDVGEMVKALGSRTEFLIDEDKKTGDILKNVESKIITLHDKFAIVFPSETSIIELFGELKDVLEETKKACSEAKTKTGEVTKVEAQITLTQPPDETGLKKDIA